MCVMQISSSMWGRATALQASRAEVTTSNPTQEVEQRIHNPDSSHITSESVNPRNLDSTDYVVKYAGVERFRGREVSLSWSFRC